jgi:hypothetical protein
MSKLQNVFYSILLFAQLAQAQTFNNRFSLQGYLKSGSTALNDNLGFPMRIQVKRNSTTVWCQDSATNIPVVDGIFSTILSGSSNCQSLTNSLSPSVFDHSANSDAFVIDVIVDVNKDGFGTSDDATFAGIDMIPSPLALSANQAETAKTLSGTVAVANGGTGASSAGSARTNLGLGNGAFGPAPAPANFTGNLTGDVTGTQTTTAVAKIQGRDVSATLPTSGQVLTWSNANSQWEPTSPAAAPVSSVAGKTGAVNIASIDITDAASANTASKLVIRDISGNFSANTVTLNNLTSSASLTVASNPGSTTNLGDNTAASTTLLRSGTGGISVDVNGTTGNLTLNPGTTSGTVTIGNSSTGAVSIGNTGAAATTTISSPVINVGAAATATTTVVGSTTGASSTTIQAGSGKIKVGSAGVAITGMGACTIAATAITTTATNYTCTGVPATASVAVHCSPAAALTTPGTNSINCRATGTLNQVACNSAVANSVSTTYTCMWIRP